MKYILVKLPAAQIIAKTNFHLFVSCISSYSFNIFLYKMLTLTFNQNFIL